MQPLEPPGQQRQLVRSKHVELLIWLSHQRRQRVHPRGYVSVRTSTFATDESKTRRVSWALKTGSHTMIQLG
jgi:hypothetical protein